MARSTIPKSRADLIDMVTDSFAALDMELEGCLAAIADTECVDGWTVKQLLAVRHWWTANILDWIETGQRGGYPVTPAKGYGWSETPRLNDDIASRASGRPADAVWQDLRAEYDRLLATIAGLDDRALLEPGVFDWAGRYPIARWISLNTARQYRTARRYIRIAKRKHDLPLFARPRRRGGGTGGQST